LSEPTHITNTKSVGCYFIEQASNAQYLPFAKLPRIRDAIILLSIHHVKDLPYMEELPDEFLERNIIIGGGHTMNNPWPHLKYCDAVFIGEAETEIVGIIELAQAAESKQAFRRLIHDHPNMATVEKIGTCAVHKHYVEDIERNPVYLNQSSAEGHADTWYIEMARGCRSKCYYCELGWTNPYREISAENAIDKIDSLDTSICNRVNVFGPDDASYSHYNQVHDRIIERGLQMNFGSMRFDTLKKLTLKHKKNFLFRFGLDSFTDEGRRIVNKHITWDEVIRDTVEMAQAGFVLFKYFVIFGYPWEGMKEFEYFVSKLYELDRRLHFRVRPIILRLKFTPLIPQPLTPLEDITPNYPVDIAIEIEKLFVYAKYQMKHIALQNDGMLQPENYYKQALLSRIGYEQFMKIDMSRFGPGLAETLAKETISKNPIVTCIDSKKLEAAKMKLPK